MSFKKYNNINSDLFNYKLNDNFFNGVVKNFMDTINYDNTNIEINKNIIDEIMKSTEFIHKNPSKVEKIDNKINLSFEFYKKSNIFATNDISKTNTIFNITEMININKQDYAYVTVFFPNYKGGVKMYDYLLPTLLVGYMLKNNYQNYDLYTKQIKGTKAQVICMVTYDVDDNAITILKTFYDKVIKVKYIGWSNEPNCINISDVSKGNIKREHGYSKVFTKLHIFDSNLFPHKKVIFLDSDLFPLMYFDSLFSLNTPAGWIEHKRQQDFNYGIASWIYDRSQYFKHGEKIPKQFTDLINIVASDVNASVLVIEPNERIFNDMIMELKQPLNKWFNNKGLWMGNIFIDYYCLPEQNYLTQKFSGQWYSVDLGFCSWLLDMDDAFGFTFAGFIKKPWLMQSAYHKYSVNPYSLFSQINNQYTMRSYGYQLLNNYICKMITENKFLKNKNLITMDISEIKYDPWEPEDNNVIMKNISKIDFYKLSLDQKKIYSLCNRITKEQLNDIYANYVLWNISKNTYNLYFTALFYNLFDILYDILKKHNMISKLYPFGNTLMSIYKFGCFDPNDDDNDFIIIVNKKTYKNIIISIVKMLLEQNICVYICLFPDKNHVEISEDNLPNKMKLSYFENVLDFNKIAFLNFSYPIPFVMQYIKDNNITLSDDMKIVNDGDNFVKVPWVDIFFLFEENNNLYLEVREFICDKHIFDPHNATNKCIQIVNKNINLPNIKDFVNIYYGNNDKLNNYTIKSSHCDNIIQRKILYNISIHNKFQYNILLNYIKYINKYIEQIYLSNKNYLKNNYLY